MPYDPTKIGIGYARLLAMQNLIRSNIGQVNTALAAFTVTAALFGQWPALTQSVVVLGDVEGEWDIKTGYLRIGISSGAQHNGLNATGEFIYIGGRMKQTRTTTISLYFHYDVFNYENSDDQREARAAATEIVGDWLYDGVLNNGANGLIPLTSTIYEASGDKMDMSHCTHLSKGFFRRGMGEGGHRVYYGILATHECIIQ